ncbi:MAG: DUF2075 domain-containing protein [Alcanivoracaceae bacterium]|nr:DUF2075 domain-containing protein [Alcanivoracaceae bacterium]
MSHEHLVEINQYIFSRERLNDLRQNAYASGCWPLVYLLSDQNEGKAYVGETADALSRLGTHLNDDAKRLLTSVHLITSERFNKSATLDIESALIKYMAADGKFSLLNGNLGLSDHNYYQREDLYSEIFKAIWDRLRRKGIAKHSIESISNSDLFKYSPYKSLSADQRQGLIGIMYALLDDNVKNLLVQGGAGTGKSVLAIFLFKLMHTDDKEISFADFSAEEDEVRDLIKQLKEKFPSPRMSLVVPMTSFRNTLKKAFRNIDGLSADMVIGPSELSERSYDIVLADEAHRLRRRVNLGAYYGAFDKTCAKLDFDKHSCSEVDWVCKQARKSVFFYDQSQSIKPSDADVAVFDSLRSESSTKTQTLVSQFRVQGGNSYVKFIHAILHNKTKEKVLYTSKSYEFLLFDSITEMAEFVKNKNESVGLSRLVAGYSWPWISKNDPSKFDIDIDGALFRWNSTNTDWINRKGAENEVGCIHTTQGYDLNYTGVIFGNEIRFDRNTKEIFIDAEKYFDRLGKQSIESPEQLRKYILNIYKTIMLRGIKGTFVYACDKDLRDYLRNHIPSYKRPGADSLEPQPILVPYHNAVPYYDLKAAAGDFSSLQKVEQFQWIAVPNDVEASKSLFACQVIGESMNRIIPNGAICLFRIERGGSRNGKIVLVEHSDLIDPDSGSQYTVKEYASNKASDELGWHHQTILLRPRSYDDSFQTIRLSEDQSSHYRVIAEFVRVLDPYE